MRTLPLDRSREFRSSDYPREPAAYTPLPHFAQRVKEPERFLDGEIIDACIEDGDLRDNGDGLACFRKVWGAGIAYYLLAGWHQKGYRVAVTAWPYLHNREEAMDSGRWSRRELDVIEEFNDYRQESLADRCPVYAEWLENHKITA